MKPRWLLLAVSVICLLLLAPAAALSQNDRYMFEAGCGTATIDGVLTGEWGPAAAVPLMGYYFQPIWEDNVEAEASHAEGPGEVHGNPDLVDVGTGYFMNSPDGRYLYVGAVVEDPDELLDDSSIWSDLWLSFGFEDEPPGDPESWIDCMPYEQFCADSDEGMFGADITHDPWGMHYGTWFSPFAWGEDCMWETWREWAPGIEYAAAYLGDVAHLEMRVDLENSHLSNVGPGQCFDMNWIYAEIYACDDGNPNCEWIDTELHALQAYWPYAGPECPILCVNPCAGEEFVPEWGSVALLGSGLMGLAGYASLRLRKK